MSQSNTPLNAGQLKKVQNLLIPLDFPSYPVPCESGTPETRNASFIDKKYKVYPTTKNIPADLKGKIANLPKAESESIEGYDGTVLTGDASLRHGKGSQMFLDGTVLDGYFSNGEFVKGRMVTPSGEFMTGVFSNQDGVKGVNYKHSNFTYEGDLDQEGGLTGTGRLEWTKTPFTCVYQGNFDKNTLKIGKLSIKLQGTVHETHEGLFDLPLDIKKLLSIKMNSALHKKIAAYVEEEKKEVQSPVPTRVASSAATAVSPSRPKSPARFKSPSRVSPSRAKSPAKNSSPTKKQKDSAQKETRSEVDWKQIEKVAYLRKLADMDRQIKTLGPQNAQLEKDLIGMQDQAKQLQSTIADLQSQQQSEFKQKQDQNKAVLDKNRTDFQSSFAKLQLVELSTLKKFHQQQLSALHEDYSKKKAVQDKKTESNKVQEDQLKQKQADLDDLKDKLQNFDSQTHEDALMELQQKIQKNKKDHTLAESTLKQVVQESLQITMNRKKAEKELADLQKKIQTAQASIDKLKLNKNSQQQSENDQVQKAQEELEKEQQRLANIESELAEIQSSKEQAEQQLNSQKTKSESELTELKSQHEALQSEADNVKKSEQESKEKNKKNLEAQLKQVTEQVGVKQKKIEEVKAVLDTKQKQIQDGKKIEEELKLKVKETAEQKKQAPVVEKKEEKPTDEANNAKLTALNIQLSEASQKHEESEQQLCQQKEQTKQLLSEYDDALKEHHALQGEMYAIQMQISLLQGYADQQDQLKQAQQSIKTDQAILDKVTKQHDGKESEINKLSDQLKTLKVKLADEAKKNLQSKQKQVDDLEEQLCGNSGQKQEYDREMAKLVEERTKKQRESDNQIRNYRKEAEQLRNKENQLNQRKKAHQDTMDKKIKERDSAVDKAKDGVWMSQVITAIMGLVAGYFASQLLAPQFLS